MTNPSSKFISFTITQPFLGAPLQFQPALGSAELDLLVDAFVAGSASKQDKLSRVTIDFFNHATVDIMTGALVRQYDVVLPYASVSEQSGYDSQSSGFSPQMPTSSPSPATFGARMRGSDSNLATRTRITKKPRKEVRKTAEAHISGFQIMTKDGVDVTSSLGRGTKTKEQRQHAHLMRIMKACDACKKKKTRCDPSHRRSHIDMSRTSTEISVSTQSNRSPAVSTLPLSLSRETTNESISSTPLSGANAIDDFVLFPEDTPWISPDLSMSGLDQNIDLSDFDFDIDVAGANNFNSDKSPDFSAFELSSLQQHYPNNVGHYDRLFSYGSFGSSAAVGYSQPHQPGMELGIGNLDSSWLAGSSSGLDYNDSPASALTPASSHMTSTSQSPALEDGSVLNPSSVSFSFKDWNMPVSTHLDGEADISPLGDRMGEDRSQKGLGETVRGCNAAIHHLVDAVSLCSSESRTFVEQSGQWSNAEPGEGLGHNEALQLQPTNGRSGQSLYKVHRGLNRTSTVVNASLNRIDPGQADYQELYEELLQRRDAFDISKSGDMHRLRLPPALSATSVLESQLQVLPTVVEPNLALDLYQKPAASNAGANPELAKQCTINACHLTQTSRSAIIPQRQSYISASGELTTTFSTDGTSSSTTYNHNQEYDVPQDAGSAVNNTSLMLSSDYSRHGDDSSGNIAVDCSANMCSDAAFAAGNMNFHISQASSINNNGGGLSHATARNDLHRVGYEHTDAALATPPTLNSMHPSSRATTWKIWSKDNWPLELNRQAGGPSDEKLLHGPISAILHNVTSLLLDNISHPSASNTLTGAAGSSTNSLLSFNKEHAWGAIPQTNLVTQVQLSGLETYDNITNNSSDSRDGCFHTSRLVAVAAMILCAATLIVSGLQKKSLSFAHMTLLPWSRSTIAAPLDILLRGVSCISIMNISTVGNWMVQKVSAHSSTTTKSSPAFIFSKSMSSIRRAFMGKQQSCHKPVAWSKQARSASSVF
ncbi:hypothetical protein BJ878DRAFT_262297 [Calycina marina]|uniref:Uncharacterized protein n=1 Tax=Calycina marina TaxID=1763456 RepID=A0A9P7YW78_9HELO|nr:hypothetical protein BJ878DRAFT_262297 [Calycina marina]